MHLTHNALWKMIDTVEHRSYSIGINTTATVYCKRCGKMKRHLLKGKLTWNESHAVLSRKLGGQLD